MRAPNENREIATDNISLLKSPRVKNGEDGLDKVAGVFLVGSWSVRRQVNTSSIARANFKLPKVSGYLVRYLVPLLVGPL